MDELREELEREGSAGWVTGLIKWLGDAANNAASSSASPLQAAYKWLLKGPVTGSSDGRSGSFDLDDSDFDPVAVQQLQTLLLGSRAATIKLIRKCPQMLEMDRQELMLRLVAIKNLFPGSNVARMVELAPAAFLDGPWPPKEQQLEAASRLLRQELHGADNDFMFQEDPIILFEPIPSLQVGLTRLRELWPGLTPEALGDSEPLHLSLAVKALGLNGPPKSF